MANTLKIEGTLEVVKTTDNKIVFADSLGDDPLATRRFTGLYLDKRDLRDAGWKGEPIRFSLTTSA